jgi:hypothetical protein
MCDRKYKPAEGQSWTSFYEEKTRELANEISRWVNSYASNGQSELLVEEVMRDHRTLQQRVMGDIVVPLLTAWADTYEAGEYHYDLRNEATCKFASDLRRLFKEEQKYWPRGFACI